jgi:hypothetical protein
MSIFIIVAHYPFFDLKPINFNKFATKPYGFIEEMRVDLTTFKLILEQANKYNTDDMLKVLSLIIIERLFRGALFIITILCSGAIRQAC